MDWKYRRKLIEQTKGYPVLVGSLSESKPTPSGPPQVSTALLMMQIAQEHASPAMRACAQLHTRTARATAKIKARSRCSFAAACAPQTSPLSGFTYRPVLAQNTGPSLKERLYRYKASHDDLAASAKQLDAGALPESLSVSCTTNLHAAGPHETQNSHSGNPGVASRHAAHSLDLCAQS